MLIMAHDADLQDESVSMQWSVVANSLYTRSTEAVRG